MKRELQLEISDVFGGDGITRPIKVESTKLKRKKSTVKTKESIGIPVYHVDCRIF